MGKTNWQRIDVTDHYLEQVRGGIPFGAEQAKVMLQIVDHFNPNPKNILDLGCGNGFLAEILLKSYPAATATLIDHSAPMITYAKANMEHFIDRCTIVEGDFGEGISKLGIDTTYDCIVSGFAIHHLPHSKKKTLYKEIYDLLSPGGVFINIEHTASSTAALENLYDNLFIDHLAAHNNRNRAEVANDYHRRPDKVDNILEHVFVQLQWLKDIGFNHTDCYFKWMELAVFGGVKKRG